MDTKEALAAARERRPPKLRCAAQRCTSRRSLHVALTAADEVKVRKSRCQVLLAAGAEEDAAVVGQRGAR